MVPTPGGDEVKDALQPSVRLVRQVGARDVELSLTPSRRAASTVPRAHPTAKSNPEGLQFPVSENRPCRCRLGAARERSTQRRQPQLSTRGSSAGP